MRPSCYVCFGLGHDLYYSKHLVSDTDNPLCEVEFIINGIIVKKIILSIKNILTIYQKVYEARYNIKNTVVLQ